MYTGPLEGPPAVRYHAVTYTRSLVTYKPLTEATIKTFLSNLITRNAEKEPEKFVSTISFEPMWSLRRKTNKFLFPLFSHSARHTSATCGKYKQIFELDTLVNINRSTLINLCFSNRGGMNSFSGKMDINSHTYSFPHSRAFLLCRGDGVLDANTTTAPAAWPDYGFSFTQSFTKELFASQDPAHSYPNYRDAQYTPAEVASRVRILCSSFFFP